jgi:hypothetical protein
MKSSDKKNKTKKTTPAKKKKAVSIKKTRALKKSPIVTFPSVRDLG